MSAYSELLIEECEIKICLNGNSNIFSTIFSFGKKTSDQEKNINPSNYSNLNNPTFLTADKYTILKSKVLCKTRWTFLNQSALKLIYCRPKKKHCRTY